MGADISVIVAIYNSEKYLSQCIESIVNQTFKALDIILVNDGSTDDSGKIADKYAEQDSRIRVIHKENGGLVSARKAGVVEAKGKYITYIDSDDYIDLDLFEKMYKWVQSENADVVACGYVRDAANGEQYEVKNGIESGVYADEKIATFYQRMINFGTYYTVGVFPSLCLKLFRRELFIENQLSVPEEITMGEDSACTFPALLKAKCIVVDNDICGYHYCEIEGSMTKSFNRNYFTNLSVLYEHLKSIYQNYPNYDLDKQLELFRLSMLYDGVDKIRCSEDMTSDEKKRYLNHEVREKSVFRNLDEVDMSEFPEKAGKRLLWIYKGNWLRFRMSYVVESMLLLLKDMRQQIKENGKEK